MSRLGRVLLAALIAAGCSAGSSSPTPSATWRGAVIEPPSLAERLEAAWPIVSRRWPGWSPSAWTWREVVSIPTTPDMVCGPVTCQSRGLDYVAAVTLPGRREVLISIGATPRHVEWEMCNAARIDVERAAVDRGCLP